MCKAYDLQTQEAEAEDGKVEASLSYETLDFLKIGPTASAHSYVTTTHHSSVEALCKASLCLVF